MYAGKEYLLCKVCMEGVYKHTLAYLCQILSMLIDFCFLSVSNMDSTMFDLLLNKSTTNFK